MFLAADQTHRDVGLAFISLCVIGMGAFFIFTPAEHLIKSDQRMARWIYKAELKASGDEKRAVAAAAAFYKWFGGTLVFFGTLVLVFAFFVRG